MYRFHNGYRGARKPGYDYAKPGLFFVTIDCNQMECRFGYIYRQTVILSAFGNIAMHEWGLVPTRFINTRLHDFQIMPNHLHGIIEITDLVKYQDYEHILSAKLKSLSDIIGAYKSFVSNECLALHKEQFKSYPSMPLMGKIWNRSFYDKIIPDQQSYKSIARYIRNNPKKWAKE